jgi:DNA-binding response OmpR family regulator
MPSPDQSTRVLCVACSAKALDILDRALRYSQWRILTAATRKKGIAVCIAENIALAVLDAESIRGKEASVASALKKVRPKLPVIMLEERQRRRELPVSVDAIVPLADQDKLLKTIQELLKAGGAESVTAAN